MTVKYIHRDMEKTLLEASRQFPAIILTGPRQSGKTTLLKHIFSKTHRYVSMDDPNLRLMAVSEPSLFFKNYPAPLIIDEIQYTPQLFSTIKKMIDESGRKKGQFILTGSQNFPLMAGVSESLAGRTAVFSLLSLSFREQFFKKTIPDVNKIKESVLTGGYPEIVVNKKINRDIWFASYMQTYLERDIRQLRQVGDITDFQRFLHLIAAHNGQVLNLSTLSRDLGVAVNTVKAWVALLEAGLQIILIKPYYINKGKRIIKSPKIYFLDTGILCHLLGITSPKQVFAGYLSGQIFETAVLGEIVRFIQNEGKVPQIYWWRTSYGEEVDFLIETGGRIIPLEVKLTSQVNTGMAQSLISFSKFFHNKVEHAILVNLSSGHPLSLGDKITAIPFGRFISDMPEFINS